MMRCPYDLNEFEDLKDRVPSVRKSDFGVVARGQDCEAKVWK